MQALFAWIKAYPVRLAPQMELGLAIPHTFERIVVRNAVVKELERIQIVSVDNITKTCFRNSLVRVCVIHIPQTWASHGALKHHVCQVEFE